MNQTFNDYLTAVREAKKHHPEWRMGQAYFNVLALMRPDISEGTLGDLNGIRASTLDPFHRDERIGAFLAEVCERW